VCWAAREGCSSSRSSGGRVDDVFVVQALALEPDELHVQQAGQGGRTSDGGTFKEDAAVRLEHHGKQQCRDTVASSSEA
jgi:hypothetical protein